MKKGRIISVDWIDPASANYWQTRERALKNTELRCNTVGRLLSKDKKILRLYGSLSANDDISDVMMIPIVCVKKITYLKGGNE